MNSAHKLLARVSEHKRDVEGDVLKQLTTYKATLQMNMAQSKAACEELQTQKESQLKNGAHAFELLMLEQSMSEHIRTINDLTCEVAALDLAIKQQKKKWADQHKKHKAHEKMHDQFESKEKRMTEHKIQATMDDQFSAQMFAKGKVEG